MLGPGMTAQELGRSGVPRGERERAAATRRARLTFLALMTGAALIGVEGAVRFLLFHPGATALAWGGALRDPALFADPALEDEYWRLRWILRGTSRDKPNAFDSLLGWTDPHLSAETYELAAPPELSGRRPLLLFGSGQVACAAPGGGCLRDALERSPLARRFALHDFSVGGQGLDQMYLLAREVVPRYRDPLVVVALTAGGDLERCNLAFQVWPKPELVPRGEGLDLTPPATSARSLLLREGTGIRSYAWRGLLHGLDTLPHGLRDRLAGGPAARRAALARYESILASFHGELERRGVESLLLVLHGPRTLDPTKAPRTLFTRGRPAPDRVLFAMLRRLGIPHIDTRPELERAAGPGEAGSIVPRLFTRGAAGQSIPNEEARAAWLRALEAALE